MQELTISADLVGQKVCNAARPDWGIGVVQRIQTQSADGRTQHRVSVQFPVVGQRVMMVPPARLIEPVAEPTREKGWLDSLGGTTLDDRLRELPDEIVNLLAEARERFLALIPLYRVDEDERSLIRWAVAQTRVQDPLAQWSRDELRAGFEAWCGRRDALLRERWGGLRTKLGPGELRELLDGIAAPLGERVRNVLMPQR